MNAAEASSALGASWAGWAVSSLTSKFYRSKTPTPSEADKSKHATEDKQTKQDVTSDAEKKELRKSFSEESVDSTVWGTIEDEQQSEHGSQSAKQSHDWNDGDGWDSFDCDTGEDSTAVTTERKHDKDESSSATPVIRNSKSKGASWDDAAWDALNEKQPRATPLSSDSDHRANRLAGGGGGQVKQRLVEHTAKAADEQLMTHTAAPRAKPGARKGPLKLGAQKIT